MSAPSGDSGSGGAGAGAGAGQGHGHGHTRVFSYGTESAVLGPASSPDAASSSPRDNDNDEADFALGAHGASFDDEDDDNDNDGGDEDVFFADDLPVDVDDGQGPPLSFGFAATASEGDLRFATASSLSMPGAGAGAGAGSYPQPIGGVSEAEERESAERAAFLQQQADALGEFHMGGGDADADADDAIDADLIRIDDGSSDEEEAERRFARAAAGQAVLDASPSMGFSSNPLALLPASDSSAMGFASNPLFGGGGDDGDAGMDMGMGMVDGGVDVDDDDEFAGNAVGDAGIYSFAPQMSMALPAHGNDSINQSFSSMNPGGTPHVRGMHGLSLGASAGGPGSPSSVDNASAAAASSSGAGANAGADFHSHGHGHDDGHGDGGQSFRMVINDDPEANGDADGDEAADLVHGEPSPVYNYGASGAGGQRAGHAHQSSRVFSYADNDALAGGAGGVAALGGVEGIPSAVSAAGAGAGAGPAAAAAAAGPGPGLHLNISTPLQHPDVTRARRIQMHLKPLERVDKDAAGGAFGASPSPEEEFTPFDSGSARGSGGLISAREAGSSAGAGEKHARSVSDAGLSLSPRRSPSSAARAAAGGGGAHAREHSLQVPGMGSPSSAGGFRSPSPASGRRTPNGTPIHRPSITSLQPNTVHNRGVSFGGGAGFSPLAAGAGAAGAVPVGEAGALVRQSYLSPAELAHVPAPHRAALDALLSAQSFRYSSSFPYSFDLPRPGSKESYEFVAALPEVGESRRVAEFVEPAVGVVTAIKNEQAAPVPNLSDLVLDRAEAPQRFTRPQRKREFAPGATLRGLAALRAELMSPQSAGRSHAHVECVVLFAEKERHLLQEHADLLGALPSLQTIQLQQVKLKKWARPLSLPNLLNFDARQCDIKEVERVSQVVLASPNLYSLTLSDNPLCAKFLDPSTNKPTLPPVEHPIWKKLLLRLPSLEYFNLIPIDNATRHRAWLHTKSKKLMPIVAAALWNSALNAATPVADLAKQGRWDPHAVTELLLPGQSLLSFSPHCLRHSLRVLDLSNNALTTLLGSGLHLCAELRSLNLSRNALANLGEVHMLAHLPLLRSLWLEGNPRLGEYHSTVIYATRHLRGSNRAPGLQELDGQGISLEQRVAAYAAHVPNAKVQAPAERWRLLLVQQFGHAQLVELPHLFPKLHMPARPLLEFADVSALTGLVSLDLRSNKLKVVGGLECLVRLRMLDVRFNPDLSHKLLVAQVQRLPTVEWVALSHSEEEMLDFTGLRAKFLAALLPRCPLLHTLDNRRVQPGEFVASLRKEKSLPSDSDVLQLYKINLAMCLGNSPPRGRRHDFQGVLPALPGSAIQSLDAVRVLDLSGMKLTDGVGPALPTLPNLSLLNLSNNKLTLLPPLGLARFPELLFLDLRLNRVKSSAMEIASALSVLPKLHGVALAGNPGWNARARVRLVACIPELASLDCALKIIDSHVTIDERVQAWGNASHMLAGEEEGEGLGAGAAAGDGEAAGPDGAAEAGDGAAAQAEKDEAETDDVEIDAEEAEADADEEEAEAGGVRISSPSAASGADGASIASPSAAGAGASPKPGHAPRPSFFQHALPADAGVDSRRYKMTLKINRDNASIHALAKKTLQKEREQAVSALVKAKARAPSISLLGGGGGGGPFSPSGNADLSRAGSVGENGLASPSPSARLLALRNDRRMVAALSPKAGGKKLSKKSREAALREQQALERNIFKFHLVLQEHCPPGQASSAIRELPLVGLGISWADFHPFLSLEKLLISHNELRSLAHCGLESLKQLKVLEAHHNRLWDLGEVLGICNELPGLVSVSFFKNPFVVCDAGVASVVERTSAQLGLVPVAEGGAAAADGADGGGAGAGAGAVTPRPSVGGDGPASPSAASAPVQPRRESILSLSSSSSLYSADKYRLTFIGHLLQLQSPHRCLQFLDHAYVTEDEVVAGLKELGHGPNQREMFRFNSAVFGMEGHLESFDTLDLSGRKLQRADLARFPHLTSLDLHSNLLSDQALLDARLPSLSRLTSLNLQTNQLKSMRKLAAMFQALPRLRHLRLLNNPGYPRVDSEKARRHLLAYFTNVHMVAFSLEFLNNQKISIDERIDAMQHAKANWAAMHPVGLDRFRSIEMHQAVALSAVIGGGAGGVGAFSPKQRYAEDEEKLGLSPHATTPPPNVGNGPNPPAAASAGPASPSGAAASEAMMAAAVASGLMDPAQVAASPQASAAQILAQGGVPLNLDEDIFTQAENARFILTAAEAGIKPSATEICLRKKGLRLLGGLTLGICSFESLLIVDLRENQLTSLAGSGIDLLPRMHTLDLRLNEFTSLDSLVVSLRACNALQWLYIQHATKSNEETSAPLQYAPAVFADLRGLAEVDAIPHDSRIDAAVDPLAKEAQLLLWKLARIGPNNLRRVDLSNRHLPSHLFYSVLSALYYLDTTELLAGGNNEWVLHPNYSDVIILLLGPKFKWLDGVEITDQRRMLAFRADKQGKQSGKITGNVVVWEEQHKAVHEDVDDWLRERGVEQERKEAAAALASGAAAKFGGAPRAGAGAGGAAASSSASSPNGGANGGANGGGKGAGGNGSNAAASPKQQQQGDIDLRLTMPNMQAVNVPVAPSAGANSSVLSNVLTKCEIVIHYLQVYGMVLVLDLNIPYPDAFRRWSTWIRLSTLNLEDLWQMDLEYQQEALFAIVMLVPALLLGLYFYCDRLRGRQDEWANSYVTRWNMVKWRTFGLYVLLLIISTTLCFTLIDGGDTLDEFGEGRQPTPASLTWALVFFGFFTFAYFVWFKIVRLFQRHWAADESELKQAFKAKWLNLIHWAQIIFLFAITTIYLPVSRVILIQFACDCVNTNADDLCQSLLYSNTTCFPSPVTRVQGAALVFAVLYIVLLPLFIIKLIREGIAIVMDLNTVYENLGRDIATLRREIGVLKGMRKRLAPGDDAAALQAQRDAITAKIDDNAKLIVLKLRQQEAEYFSRINDPIRKLASTSLYAAYEYDWRFWKIIQLVQNLLLVCISLFVPTTIGSIEQARVFLGAFAIGGFFLFAAWVRPYYDSWEDGMEVFAGLANTVTVMVALGLQYKLSWLTPDLSNAILLAANIAAVVAFVVAIVIVPCRIWKHKKMHKKQEKEAEERIKALNEDNKKQREAKRAAARKLKLQQQQQQQQQAAAAAQQAQAQGSGSTPPAVAAAAVAHSSKSAVAPSPAAPGQQIEMAVLR